MSEYATPTPTAGAQTDDQTRDCQRCGRDRPADPQRFTITASDFTDNSADYEQARLCGECWRTLRDQLRRSIA